MSVSLYGTDLFGASAAPKATGPVAERFLFPPFTLLDAKSGEWQERKRAWLAMGIKSEVGRSGLGDSCATSMDYFNEGKTIAGDSGSVFDPVVCELVYRWFCPDGGQVVDPFSGGSVRGLVAASLGLKYWGGDLRQEQITANHEQAKEILPNSLRVPIVVSGPMLRQEFHPCEANFIAGVCKGRCCEGTGGIKVAVHPTEEAGIRALGEEVVDGYMVADDRGLCPFKLDSGLCKLHGHEAKPFGCRASPFTLNDNDTMIVRNRYRLLKCYTCEGAVPAYEAHRWSLGQVFGEEEADRIASEAKAGAEKIPATLDPLKYSMLRHNDDIRHERTSEHGGPQLQWVCGDSNITLDTSPKADFVFSCPPYGDLEEYSDDPNDLSNMEWPAFVEAYRAIIAKAVSRLKNDRFACFVVGDFRDQKGFYRNFVSTTIQAFEDAGARLYNEAILATPVGTACLRVTRQFNAQRKLAKTHQNVLIFCKGDPKKASAACKPSEVA